MSRPGKNSRGRPDEGSGGSPSPSSANPFSYPYPLNLVTPQEYEDFVRQLEALQLHDSTLEEATLPLGTEYRPVEDPRQYFIPGVVFKTPWSMPAGPRTSPNSPYVTPSAFGQQVYTEMTRFLVWISKPTHCLALAIHTYGGLGADKFTLRPGDRCRVFDATKEWDTARILKKEIPIWVQNPKVSIDYPYALLDLSQIFTVHFYAPILHIGYVHGQAWPAVEGCVRQCLNIIGDSELSNVLSDVANDFQRSTEREVENPDEGQEDRQRSQASPVVEYVVSERREVQNSSPRTHWTCDWLGCPRGLQTFSRIDHYRDHLRDFHQEDILGKKRKDLSWFQSRRIYPDWWRCSNCLSRVRIEESGLDCDVCNRPCEPERQEFRATLFPPVLPVVASDEHLRAQWNLVQSRYTIEDDEIKNQFQRNRISREQGKARTLANSQFVVSFLISSNAEIVQFWGQKWYDENLKYYLRVMGANQPIEGEARTYAVITQ